MFSRVSALRRLAPVVAGIVYCAALAHGQTRIAAKAKDATITTAVDGLACTSLSVGSFEALSFQITVTDILGGGGGGAGKAVFTDLSIQKATDACSLPLFLLSVNGKHLKKLVLTQIDKSNKPVLTITIEDVVVHSTQLGTADPASGVDALTFSYAFLTITDGAGNSTGRITVQAAPPPV